MSMSDREKGWGDECPEVLHDYRLNNDIISVLLSISLSFESMVQKRSCCKSVRQPDRGVLSKKCDHAKSMSKLLKPGKM